MSLLLNEDQVMLTDSIRTFLDAEAPVQHLRKLRDERSELGMHPTLWRHFAEVGGSGMLVSEAQGGLALGAMEVALVAEQIGRNLSPLPFLSTSVLVGRLVESCGRDDQKNELLPGVVSGEQVLALALDEASKHAPASIQATATAVADGFVLNGTKTCVVDGFGADRYVVIARMAEADRRDDIAAFLVPRDCEGLGVERLWLLDSRNAGRMVLQDVKVPASALLGKPGDLRAPLDAVLDLGRCAIAGELLGICTSVFDTTLGYLKQRKQFGKCIGEFQALQHRAARMYGEIELLRAAVMRAAREIDQVGPQAALLVSVAKAKAGKVAKLCTEEAIQMHGGIGMTDELDIGLYFKRSRVLNELLGDTRFHADRVANIQGY